MDLLDIGSILNPIKDVIDHIIPDKTAAAQAKAALDSATLNGQLAEQLTKLQAVTTNQTDVDKVEAGSASVFVAGWRPAVGWICAAGLGMQFIVGPLATYGASLAGKAIAFPSLDMGTLLTMLGGLLGLGAMHSYDKVQGVAETFTGAPSPGNKPKAK